MTILACPKCEIHLCSDSKGMCFECEKERRVRRMVLMLFFSCLLYFFAQTADPIL